MMHGDSYLYRLLTRRFPTMHADDVVDAIYEAREAHLQQAMRVGRVVENVVAYTTVVAKRALSRTHRRKMLVLTEEYIGEGQLEACLDKADADRFSEEVDALDASIECGRILERIPVNYAEVLRMHYLEGITLDETSKRLGCSPQCIRKRHERALRWARKRFGSSR